MVQRVRRFGLNLVASMLSGGVITKEFAELLVRTITRKESIQTTAANLTSTFLMRAAGRIVAVRVMRCGAAAASGESMTVDAQIAGVSALSAVVTINNTTAADTFVSGTLNSPNTDFAAGDALTIVRAYTAGGTPTPMTNTLVEVDIAYME